MFAHSFFSFFLNFFGNPNIIDKNKQVQRQGRHNFITREKQQNKSYKLGTTAGVLGAICQEWHRANFYGEYTGRYFILGNRLH